MGLAQTKEAQFLQEYLRLKADSIIQTAYIVLAGGDDTLVNTYNPTLERDILKNIRQISNALFDFDNMARELEIVHGIIATSNQLLGE
jgi:hypothetical protein